MDFSTHAYKQANGQLEGIVRGTRAVREKLLLKSMHPHLTQINIKCICIKKRFYTTNRHIDAPSWWWSSNDRSINISLFFSLSLSFSHFNNLHVLVCRTYKPFSISEALAWSINTHVASTQLILLPTEFGQQAR